MSSFNKNIKAVRSPAIAFRNAFKIYPFMKKGFFTNKYTLSVFILLAILATDVLLHKGMSRVILPEKFTDKRQPQKDLPICTADLQVKGKKWVKAINTPVQVLALDSNVNGLEMDVYFDTAQNEFRVYHDSTALSETTIEDVLDVVKERRLSVSTWLDFKNLSQHNKSQALKYLSGLKEKYNLGKRLIVESSDIVSLKTFCDSGFFTSYYVPFFNPYSLKENQMIAILDTMSADLKRYPVTALSGYYFQVPFLKKYFPVFPLLTWTEDSKVSLVNIYFNHQLENDKQVMVILHNIDNQ